MDAGQPSGPHGAKCGGTNRQGAPCGNAAGYKTDHPGFGNCHFHGGSSPNGQVHAERQMAEQTALRFGLDMTEISGGEALLREVCRSAAMTDWLARQVAELNPDDLIWGLTGRRITQPTTPGGQPQVIVEQRARIHPWVVMLRDERATLARVAEAAHRCGIEERMMRNEELKGSLIAKVVAAILNDPDLDMRPEQRAKFGQVVPRHLRAMDGAA